MIEPIEPKVITPKAKGKGENKPTTKILVISTSEPQLLDDIFEKIRKIKIFGTDLQADTFERHTTN